MNVNKNSGKSLKENSEKNTFGLRCVFFDKNSGKLASIWDEQCSS